MTSLIPVAGHWRPGKRRTLPPHLNAGLEMVLVTGGQTRWRIGDRVEIVPSGSVFYTFPWERHGGVTEVEPGLELWFVVLTLERPYRRPVRNLRFHPSMPMTPAVRRWIVHTMRDSPRHAVPASKLIGELIRQMVAQRRSDEAGRDVLLAGLATAALVELARCAAGAGSSPPPSDVTAASRVMAFRVELVSRAHEPWTLTTMARHCGLGRTRFAELLKQQTGDTPTMALNRLRVQRAQQALRQSDRPVTQIALDCGFSSSQYFARVFREYAGCTALAFRSGRG